MGILDITLVSGKLLDEIRADELLAEVRLKHAPYRNPINTRAFHPDLLYVIFAKSYRLKNVNMRRFLWRHPLEA